MKLPAPAPLKAEHDELHARLVKATQAPGALSAVLAGERVQQALEEERA